MFSSIEPTSNFNCKLPFFQRAIFLARKSNTVSFLHLYCSLREHGVTPVAHYNDAIQFYHDERLDAMRRARIGDRRLLVANTVCGIFLAIIIPPRSAFRWWSVLGNLLSFATLEREFEQADWE